MDRPIIFSAPMVRALLDGRKTQTRRLAKPRGKRPSLLDGQWSDSYVLDPGNAEWLASDIPFAVGDRLYVRENWRAGYADDWYREDLGRCPRPTDLDPATTAIEYLADGTRELGGKTRVAIHMPRWASRLTLIVEGVKVERLQDISDEDAIAEGLVHNDSVECADGVSRAMWFGIPQCGYEARPGAPRQAYLDLWDSLHNPRGLCADDEPSGAAANPWVVAVTFRVVRGNIDTLEAANA